jgi:hypothetical protein
VLPYQIGIQLGAIWDESRANIRLAGGSGSRTAMPLMVMTELVDVPLVRLAFAWTKTDDSPVIPHYSRTNRSPKRKRGSHRHLTSLARRASISHAARGSPAR